jgi:phosphatidate cytidylyltransferase
LAYNFNRLYVGIILCAILFLSYYFKLDYLILLLIIGGSIFDLWKSNLLSRINILLFFVTSISLFFIFYLKLNLLFYIYFILFILVFLSFFLKSYANIYFPIIIIISVYLLINLSVNDRDLIYFCFLLSFLNDTSAYFFGNLIKGPLILPNISPKKTWSGTLISSLISITILYSLDYNFLFSFFVGISFFIGDIYFSYIKRLLNLKDFSNLLRSHGGVLDRLDSIFLIVIFFNIYL